LRRRLRTRVWYLLKTIVGASTSARDNNDHDQDHDHNHDNKSNNDNKDNKILLKIQGADLRRYNKYKMRLHLITALYGTIA
jgi:hypothetical protein